MSRTTLAASTLLAALPALALARIEPPMPGGGPSAEPRRRVVVTFGEERLELELGGAAVRAADGRELSVAELPTRVFRAPGAFRFEYRADWSFCGAPAPDSAAMGWWTVSGDYAVATFQRFGSDPDAALERYVSGLEAAGGGVRRACELELDGRTLSAFEVDSTTMVIGYGARASITTRVAVWRDEAGVAWLCALQSPNVEAPSSGAWPAVQPDPRLAPREERLRGQVALAELIESFRWER